MSKARVKTSAEQAEDANTVVAASAQIVREASKAIETTDALGRRLVIRKLSARERLKLFEIIGSLSTNTMYLGQVALVVAVREIDGEKVPFPLTKRELDALVDRVEDEGMDAAGVALKQILGIEVDDDGNVTMTGAGAAKNS